MLFQVRKEYEMLRIEFEQQLAANEQTGPINREMRHLITSLQNHNQQLKGEVHRYRRYLNSHRRVSLHCAYPILPSLNYVYRVLPNFT